MSGIPYRRAVATIDGVRIEDCPRPEPAAHELGVETVIAGVCGSDTHALAGQHPFLPLPYFPGHEVVGIVREKGSEVEGFDLGDHITVEPTLPCGHCKMCASDRSNICENLRFFGCGHPQGGMSDYFTVDAARAHQLPADLSDLDGALVEPLATPVHAVRLSGGVHGKAVAVLGAGTIGLLTLAAARAAGARRVVVTDVRDDKRQRALHLGADAVVDAGGPDVAASIREALGESADVVFDCVAARATVDQAISAASKGGIVMIVGVPATRVEIALPTMQDHQIRVQGSATYMPEDFRRAIELVREGRVRGSDFVTAEFALADVAAAFAASSSGEHVKVVLVRDVPDRR